MKRELVGVRDLRGFWAFTMDVSYTEGKNILTYDDFIDIVNKIPEFSNCSFVQDDIEIYALLDDNVDFCFNSGCNLK